MLRNYGEVLRIRAVRTVLLAAAVSVAGDSAAMVALVLRVHAAGAGPWAVSLLLLAFAVPVVVTMGVAGSLADRGDARRVLATTALVQAAAAAALAAVDGLAATFALVLLLQTAFALGSPSWSAVVPALVPEGAAGRVVALQQALRGVAAPLGAGVGGVLVQWRGPSAALLLDGLTFLVLAGAALTLRGVARTPETDAGPRPGTTRRGAAAAWLPRDGVAALRADPVLGVLVLALLPLVVTLESVNVVEVFLVRDVLDATAAQYGLAEAVHGAAAVLGAVLSGLAVTRPARVRVVLASLAAIAVAQAGQGLAPDVLVYLALGVGVGVFLGVANALVMALVLDELDHAHRGSVIALVGGLSRGAGALALALGATLGTLAGPRVAYVVAGGAGLLVAAAAAWATRRVHRSVDAGSTARASRPGPVPSTLEA